MWTPENGIEVRKCRHRLAPYIKGQGLDIGCGDEKISRDAIGVNSHGKAVDIQLDLSANDSLGMFSDNSFDYVFSCHTLQRFLAWKAVLKEWWRVVRAGGTLILYQPDPEFTPRIGTPGAEPKKVIDLTVEDVSGELEKLGAKVVSSTRHNESNEHSWQLIVRKKASRVKKVFESLERLVSGKLPKPLAKRANSVCVVRFGAFGDTLWCTPLFQKLKEDGYYVAFCTAEKTAQVVKENPNIDEFIVHETKGKVIPTTPNDHNDYVKKLEQYFDRVIDLTHSCEHTLLKTEGTEGFDWPHEKRHQECNKNYQDFVMQRAGYEVKGKTPYLHFTEIEEYMAQRFRNQLKDKFIILWSLAGSAFHKVYPWAEYVAHSICRNHNDVVIVTVGDYNCKILEWQNGQTINKSGEFTIRQSMILTKYVDLVIGAETGILNAAAAFDTPKVVFLSHSSRENLTKHWTNTDAIFALDCPCHPCHKLIFTNTCPRGSINGEAPRCMENIDPQEVLECMEKWYSRWGKKKLNPAESQLVASLTGQKK